MRLIAFAAVALAALVVGAPAMAGTAMIQPGAKAGIGCTLNFVFDGTGELTGRVFVGIARHCVDGLGQSATSGPYQDFGVVALMGPGSSVPHDWALIEVHPAFHPYVVGAVKGHPGFPTGVATQADTMSGDLVQFSGYGAVFELTQPTQEERVGVLVFNDGVIAPFVGPTSQGDSGGPIVHIKSGKALALVSGPEVGPTIENMVNGAAAQGFTVALRTV